jgi:hypothetical protein
MSSAGAMAALGPLLYVVFRPHRDLAPARNKRRGDRVAMLVDTGAACTMVDGRTARALGYEPVRLAHIGGSTGSPEPLPVYVMEMTIRFVDEDGRTHDVTTSLDVVGFDPRPQRGTAFGLLGRDCLARMRFVYDGPRGAFSLIADDPPSG